MEATNSCLIDASSVLSADLVVLIRGRLATSEVARPLVVGGNDGCLIQASTFAGPAWMFHKSRDFASMTANRDLSNFSMRVFVNALVSENEVLTGWFTLSNSLDELLMVCMRGPLIRYAVEGGQQAQEYDVGFCTNRSWAYLVLM